MASESHLCNLFSPFKLRGHVLKNRIFSTGHMAVMLENCMPSKAMVAYHSAKAKGGAALTIIEAARTHPSGDTGRPAIRAYDPASITGYSDLADACHAHKCKVFAQLSHPGREMTIAADGSQPVAYAPSAIPNERFHVMPREMPLQVINQIIKGFAISAGNLRRAGIDGVEIVASHGYLIGQFINPRINQRTDSFGGSLENRLRFLRKVLKAVRSGAGEKMVVGVRISGDERDFGGIKQDEMIELSKLLGLEVDLDYLSVAAGTSAGLLGSTHIVPPMQYTPAYTAPLAASIKIQVNIPVFVAGRINQPHLAEQILINGQADMCGMTRALISDPEMPRKAKAGQFENIRFCVACNQACIGHMLNSCAISCIQHPETGRELKYEKIPRTESPKKIIVIGGGPAGMKVASVASKRGHNVTIFESAPILGGQVNLAQLLPGRAEFGGITTNLSREAEDSGVIIKLNTPFSRNLIDIESPDEIVLATGARPHTPCIDGADEAHVVTAWQVLQGETNVGSRVVIADWRCDWIGLGLAEQLARNGCHVRLAVNGVIAGQMIPQYVRDKWLGDLHALGVEVVSHVRLYGVDSEDAYFQHTLSRKTVILNNCDTLVTALGHQANNSLEKELKEWEGSVHIIGDALCPRTVEEAVLEGLKIGVSI